MVHIDAEEEQDRDFLFRKINKHMLYLEQMQNYLFICPEHNTSAEQNKEKSCSDCDGVGKSFWRIKCKTCNGSGKIFYSMTTSKKCSFCDQLYRGSISGRALYGNH